MEYESFLIYIPYLMMLVFLLNAMIELRSRHPPSILELPSER